MDPPVSDGRVFIRQRGRDEPGKKHARALGRVPSKETKTSSSSSELGVLTLPLLTYYYFYHHYRRQNRAEILKGRLRAREEACSLQRPGGEERTRTLMAGSSFPLPLQP
jgi:hypothetical protein